MDGYLKIVLDYTDSMCTTLCSVVLWMDCIEWLDTCRFSSFIDNTNTVTLCSSVNGYLYGVN